MGNDAVRKADDARIAEVCDLCGTGEVNILLTLPPYRIVKCKSCGLIYAIPRPNQAEVSAIYNESYFVGGGQFGYKAYEDYLNDETRLDIFRERVSIIERYRRPPGLMIDVGCASGFGLRAYIERGWDALGVEVSEFAAELARTRYSLKVIDGTLDSAHFPNEYADVVTMWDVIEHLPSPRRECLEVNRILKSGGVLAIATPDADCPNLSPGNQDPAKAGFWMANPPEHIHYFSCATISRLLSETGFRVLMVQAFGAEDRRAGAFEVYAVKVRTAHYPGF